MNSSFLQGLEKVAVSSNLIMKAIGNRVERKSQELSRLMGTARYKNLSEKDKGKLEQKLSELHGKTSDIHRKLKKLDGRPSNKYKMNLVSNAKKFVDDAHALPKLNNKRIIPSSHKVTAPSPATVSKAKASSFLKGLGVGGAAVGTGLAARYLLKKYEDKKKMEGLNQSASLQTP